MISFSKIFIVALFALVAAVNGATTNHETMLKMRWTYAEALYLDTSVTLDNLREAVTKLEDLAPNARRVFGGAHPAVVDIERALQNARAALRAREAPN